MIDQLLRLNKLECVVTDEHCMCYCTSYLKEQYSKYVRLHNSRKRPFHSCRLYKMDLLPLLTSRFIAPKVVVNKSDQGQL